MLNQPIAELPESVSPYAALETAYRSELSRILMHISQERNIIIRTEKLNFPYLNRVLRKLLEDQGFELVLISGRNEAGGIPSSRVQNMVRQFEEAVNSYDESTVFLFPYIDILTSSRHGLSNEGREILTLIHENPGLRLIALEDPEFPLHSLVVQAFFSRISLEGVSRHQIVHMITRNEARRLE